jgi:hypothetical protein
MKDVRKVFAFVLTLTLLLSFCYPSSVFASDSFKYETEANYLHDMGLYTGTSLDAFIPDLGLTVPKEQGVAILIRVLGLEGYALDLSEDAVSGALDAFSDSPAISGWARHYVAAGVIKSLVNGNPDGNFGPGDPMDARMMAKLILCSAGYAVDSNAYQAGPYILKDNGAYTLEQAQYFMGKTSLIRDDLVGMTFNALKLRFSGSDETIIRRLVAYSVVSEKVALNSGAYTNDIIKKATEAVSAYESAPYSTSAQVAAGLKLKSAAEALIAKFVEVPTAGSVFITTIRNTLLSRIKVQQAKINSTATF